MNFRILAAPGSGRIGGFSPYWRRRHCLQLSSVQRRRPNPGSRARSPHGCAESQAQRLRPRRLLRPRHPHPGGPGLRRLLPGAPAAAAQQPRRQQVPQLIYAPWTKFCLKGPDAGAKQVCFTGKDGRIESGQPVIAAVIIEPEGEPKKILRVTLPLDMQLVHGTRVIVDNNPPAQSRRMLDLLRQRLAVCPDYEVTPELLASMKKGPESTWFRRSTPTPARH